MEYVIAILLAIIIYFLWKSSQDRKHSYSRKSETYVGETFTKEEWYEAVNDYKKTERIYNNRFYPTPGFVFSPDPGLDLPSYEEVKDKPHEFANLKHMTQEMKGRIAKEPPRKL
jgi:hypothetical protein